MVMEIIPLYNRPASELQPLISPMLEDSEYIIDNGSNLIVKATPVRLEEIKKLIIQLDARLNNLSITVIQSRTKTARILNAEANIHASIPFTRPSRFSGRFNGHFAQTDSLNNNDSTQIVNTLEGRPAYIKTGQVHPVQHLTIHDSGYGTSRISSTTQFIEATTGFLVNPRLTGEQVTIEVTPWSDKMNNRGNIETQGANTTIRVKLGEWVEIGGISEQSQNTRNGTLSHSYSTKNKNMRILIKVDKM